MPVLTRSQTRLINKRSAEIGKIITDYVKQNAVINDMLRLSSSKDETYELMQMLQSNENMLTQLNRTYPSIVRYVLCDKLNLEKYYNKLFQ